MVSTRLDPQDPRRRDLADQLHFVAVHLLRVLRAQEETAGVSTARLSALEVIVRDGPLAVKDLAARERVRSPTMVRVVDELLKRELVTKENSESDRRVTLVKATEAGERRLERDRETVREALLRAVSTLATADPESLSGCVGVLYRALAEEERP